jgi:hypothetical protein
VWFRKMSRTHDCAENRLRGQEDSGAVREVWLSGKSTARMKVVEQQVGKMEATMDEVLCAKVMGKVGAYSKLGQPAV